MEFMLDTANIADIKKFEKIIPLAGVTSNPSIVKNEGNICLLYTSDAADE